MPYRKPEKYNDGLNATQRYHNKCDAFTIRPLKAEGEKIRAAAEKYNMSLTQLMVVAVNEYIANHKE